MVIRKLPLPKSKPKVQAKRRKTDMANEFEKNDPNKEKELPGQKNVPDSTSAAGTPMTHKETGGKPIYEPRPDAQNPDTNANVGEDKPNLTSSTAQEDKWAKFRQGHSEEEIREMQKKDKEKSEQDASGEQKNYNPHPVTAGSAEDRKMSAGEYTGDLKPGTFIKVSPLNAADEDFVVGKVTTLDVSGLGSMVYFDASANTKVASFHADDAEILYEPPPTEVGKRVFVNDDQTYDARELKMERPKNEKQYVRKQEILRDETAKSHFAKSLL